MSAAGGADVMRIEDVNAAHVGVCAETNIPVPATYIMVCCHGADKGTKFLANGEWDARHDYRDFGFALDQMRKIKKAGINVVGVHESTKNDSHAYYNVVKEEIAKRRAGCACRAQRP